MNDKTPMSEDTIKEIKDMSVEEILHQQLELLAERSKDCTNEELSSFTNAMSGLCRAMLL